MKGGGSEGPVRWLLVGVYDERGDGSVCPLFAAVRDQKREGGGPWLLIYSTQPEGASERGEKPAAAPFSRLTG